MNITFESDNKAFMAHLAELKEKVTPAAQASALNSAGGFISRGAIKLAFQKTGVPANILKRRIGLKKKATARLPEIIIRGGVWKVKVADLKPAPRKLAGGRAKYNPGTGNSINPNAFIANNTNGRLSVFVRKGSSRLPIENILTDIRPGVMAAIGGYSGGREALSYYQKILVSQLDRRVRQSLRREGLSVS